MLKYDRQPKPGLVALYDIRPGNGAGLFLQPRSPHGANTTTAANEKKRSEEKQTLRAGCSKAEPKILTRRRPPTDAKSPRWL